MQTLSCQDIRLKSRSKLFALFGATHYTILYYTILYYEGHANPSFSQKPTTRHGGIYTKKCSFMLNKPSQSTRKLKSDWHGEEVDKPP